MKANSPLNSKYMLHSMARPWPRTRLSPDEDEQDEHDEQPAPPPSPSPPPAAGDTSDEVSPPAIVTAAPAADPPSARRTWAVAFSGGHISPSSMADEDSEPADDPNDRDFAPSPHLRRPRPRLPRGVPVLLPGGVWVEDDPPAVANAIAPPAIAPNAHASETTIGVCDMASAKKDLIAKMSAHGHQAFIR